MELEGTVVNGVIVLDGIPPPDGTRVRVNLAEEPDPRIPALEPGTREQEISALRESIEDMKAGRVRPAREVLKAMALRHGIPLEPGE